MSRIVQEIKKLTLMEWLVIFAIISILAATIVPHAIGRWEYNKGKKIITKLRELEVKQQLEKGDPFPIEELEEQAIETHFSFNKKRGVYEGIAGIIKNVTAAGDIPEYVPCWE